MPRGKPQYNKPPTFADLIRSGTPPAPPVLGEPFRSALKSAVKQKLLVPKSKSNDPAIHAFIEALALDADWALGQVTAVKLEITKADRLAEIDDLIRALRSAMRKLRSISPDLDALLGIEFHPLDAADEIERVRSKLDQAAKRIESLELTPTLATEHADKRNRQSSFNAIARELTQRVASDASNFGVKLTASTNSPIVTILKIMGDQIGLAFSTATWRDILNPVIRARRNSARVS